MRIIPVCAVWFCAVMLFCCATSARADSDPPPDEVWGVHGQITLADQYHPGFASAYRGTNSLDPGSRGDETIAATLYAGLRLWDGGQLYIDPEIDQGFGLSDTFGIAAFPSGEAYKVGDTHAYFRLQKLFIRQVIGLGGATQTVDPGPNQLGLSQKADSITLTLGKFSATDVFDTNAYAHDPTSDFMNWALIDGGAFDYAADAWGYTYGGTAEWTQAWWTLRGGVFALSRIPNGKELQTDFRQYEVTGEAEGRFDLLGREGKFKLLGYLNAARMGSYNDALRLADATGELPDTALVRHFKTRPGFEFNLEQPLTDELGAFLRASASNGDQEAYEFTDIDESVSGGVSLKGNRWGRIDDTVGVAAIVSGLSSAARHYFSAGGLGTLIGDGRLQHYETEDILEAYYSSRLMPWLSASLDYQFVANPAYNAERGPVSVFGIRLHAAF